MIIAFDIMTICSFVAGTELAIFFDVMRMEAAYEPDLIIIRLLAYAFIAILILRFSAANRDAINEIIKTKNYGLILKILF